jgi:hypothetical protein
VNTRKSFCLAVVFVVVGTSFGASREIRFDEFPATNIFRGKPAEPELKNNPQARQYRTQLRTQTANGANFAGHFRLVSWGCGNACKSFAIVDCKSGRVYFKKDLPQVKARPSEAAVAFDFRIDSKLVIVRGALIEDGGFETNNFLWDGKQLTLTRNSK